MSDTLLLSNVARFLAEAAEQVPHQCAVRVPLPRSQGEALVYRERSFEELERESNAAALYLQSLGVNRQTRVLLMVKPGLELILLTFALFKIGAVPVVIDPGMGLKNFLKCVQQTKPKVLIGIPLAVWVSRLFFRRFRSVQMRIKVDGASFLEKIKSYQGQPFELANTQAEELAAILFTSGSTGPPKGVCYEHGNFEAQVRLIKAHYAIAPGEVDLPMLPIFALFNPAMQMTTVVPEMNPSRPGTVDPANIVEAIQANKVTSSFGSPVLWTKIGRYCEEQNITLPTIQRILIAGAPVSPELIRLFQKILPNGKIHTPYGATESLPVTSICGDEILEETWALTEQGRGTCVGHVFPEMQVNVIAISDAVIESKSAAQPMQPGEIGEIIVKGPVVTKQYDQLATATASAKIKEPATGAIWHRIGDLGYFDKQGRLWFCGRKAERVETEAGLLLTDPCEGIINRHPDVYRSALIGVGPRGRQTAAIVIEPEAGLNTSEEGLLQSVRAHAQAHPITEKIEHFFMHSKFPVDVRHNAKIHRLTLAQIFENKL